MTMATDNSIANQTPDGVTFPVVPKAAPNTLTNPAKSPLQSAKPEVRRAWQWSLWSQRKKNRAGRPAL
jgi:hypothetical protein